MLFRRSSLLIRIIGRESGRCFSSNTGFGINEQTIRIRTCRDFYSSLGDKKLNIFRKCPASGIDMDIKYIDSHPSPSPHHIPTVLTVHGTPGSYNDFDTLISILRSSDFRVVSCNMPGFDFTLKTGTFRHTTEERAELLRDWLSAIGVKRVDVAVMHSSACYPTLELWDSNPGLIRSLALLHPAGHRTIKGMKPEWYTSFAVHTNQTLMGHLIFKSLGGCKVITSVKNDAEHAITMLHAMTTMRYAKVERMVRLLNQIRETTTPAVYLYSDADRLVDQEISEEMLQMLAPCGSENLINLVSKTGELIQQVNSKKEDHNDWLRVFRVAKGGHYAYKGCSKLLVKEITRLIAQVYIKDVMKEVKSQENGFDVAAC